MCTSCSTQKTIADLPPISNLFLPVPDPEFCEFMDEAEELACFAPEIIAAIDGDLDASIPASPKATIQKG